MYHFRYLLLLPLVACLSSAGYAKEPSLYFKCDDDRSVLVSEFMKNAFLVAVGNSHASFFQPSHPNLQFSAYMRDGRTITCKRKRESEANTKEATFLAFFENQSIIGTSADDSDAQDKFVFLDGTNIAISLRALDEPPHDIACVQGDYAIGPAYTLVAQYPGQPTISIRSESCRSLLQKMVEEIEKRAELHKPAQKTEKQREEEEALKEYYHPPGPGYMEALLGWNKHQTPAN